MRISGISEGELDGRTGWFIELRWLAIAGVATIITVAVYLLAVNLPLLPLYGGTVLLFLCNCIFLLYNNSLKKEERGPRWIKKINLFANVQVLTDLVILTYFLHFSGSLENPFVFYFVFHMVIASILLSNRAAYLHATLAGLLLGLVVSGEYFGVLQHYHLSGFSSAEHFYGKKYLAGYYFVLCSTLYITVFMATSIVNRLREGESRLAEQDGLKSRYVLTVSHELKSSISTIQSCLKVVLDGLTGPVSEKSREFISRAETRSRSMLIFVKDLLDLSSIRAEKDMQRNAVSFFDITGRAVDQLRPRLNEKKIDFRVETKLQVPVVFVNEEAIERVVVNLIENALRYTPACGKISIILVNSGGFIEMEVSDNGIGIAEEDLMHLFEDFYRAKNARAMEKDGTGLGLSIVKQILESHSGKIWVESQLGKGSKFIMALPEYVQREQEGQEVKRVK